MHCEPNKGEPPSVPFLQGRHNHVVNWLHDTMPLLRRFLSMSLILTKACLSLTLCLSVQFGTFAGLTILSAWSTGTLIAVCNRVPPKCLHIFDHKEAERREDGRQQSRSALHVGCIVRPGDAAKPIARILGVKH